MGRIALLYIGILILSSSAFAESKANQVVTQSWHGLSGLYVIPTARTIGRGKLAAGYNESKHVEYIGSKRFSDRQVLGVVTYGITDSVEISGAVGKNLLDIGDNYVPQFSHQSIAMFSLKWRVLDETRRRPAIALAVRDITNDMQDIEPLENIHNGRKYFLLASKRLIENDSDGRFLDGHVGVTHDELATSALFGFELALTPSISYIAEGMWDSPYLNFRGIYSGPGIMGEGDQQGRFIFDTGLRMYPDLVPGVAIDAGFVGDGVFEFAFGFSYVMGM